MTARILSCILFAVLLVPEFVTGQTNYAQEIDSIKNQQQSTRAEIERLRDQIETYRNRLRQTSEEYDDMYSQYQELTRMISIQDEKIQKTEQEQRQIEQEISLIRGNIQELENELERLIDQYQQTLTYLYKHGRTTEIALVLTSTSINQLMVRAYYLARFDRYRSEQENEIRNKQDQFEQARYNLEQTRQRNEETLAEIQLQKEELAEQERRQEQTVRALRQDRERLRGRVTEHETQLNQLDNALTELMEEEARIHQAQREEEERRRRLAEAEQIEDEEEREAAIARYSQPVNRTLAAVSEEELRAFESGFRESRGQLPWPVENGTVTERFGERVHPVFQTRTNNPGIDIATAARSQVKTVHDGYVFAIQPFTGFGDVVMVHHGRYITVYGNLSDIFVSRGEVLSRGDLIGLSGDEDSIRGEVLFFMIRDGSTNVNPESWIQRTPP